MNRTLVWTTTLAAVLAVMLGGFSDTAEAARLKAKIYMTQEKIPRGLSEKDLLDFAKKNHTQRIEETKQADVKERKWRANLVIAFNASPGELAFGLAFYDVQKGVRVPIEDQSILLSDRTQKTYVQRIALKRPLYKPNRKLELTVSVRRQEVGRLKFSTVGEAGP